MKARPEQSGRDGGSRTRNAVRYELRPGTARIAAMGMTLPGHALEGQDGCGD